VLLDDGGEAEAEAVGGIPELLVALVEEDLVCGSS